MNADQINNDERKRLLNLIENSDDKLQIDCLRDDVEKLDKYPEKYWFHFNIEAYQPGTIVETQRKNTIVSMQNHYQKI